MGTARRSLLFAGLIALALGALFVLRHRSSPRPAPVALEGREQAAPAAPRLQGADDEPALGALTRAAPELPALKVTGVVRVGPQGKRRAPLRGQRPVRFARVELELERDGRTHFLARGLTDRTGRFEIEAAVPPELADARLRVTALAQRALPASRGGLRPRPGQALRVDLALRPGIVATGLVQSAAGRPAMAEVLLLARNAPEADVAWIVAERARSFADGRFALSCPHPGTWSVLARAERLGTARVDGRALDERGADLGVLTLRGEGALLGRATFADGEPCAGLELVALPAALALEAEQTGADATELAEARFAALEASDGRVQGRARADAEGHFELRGLRPGAYALHPARAEVELARPQAVHWTGAPVELVVASRVVELELVLASGAPAAGAGFTALVETPEGALEPRAVPCDPEGRARLDLPASATALGLAIELRRGPRHDLRLELPPTPSRLERRVELPDPLAPGRLALTLRGGGLPGYAVTLRSAASGLEVLRYGLSRAEGALSPPLAPGAYRAHLEPRERPRRDDDLVAFDAPEPLVVRAGETTPVELTPRRGGRLSLELVPPPGWVEETLGVVPGWRPERARAHLKTLARPLGRPARATLRPVGEDEAWELLFDARGRLGRGRRAGLVPGLETGLSLPVPEGDYVLTVQAPGFAAVEHPLRLEAGVVTSRALALVPAEPAQIPVDHPPEGR